MKYTLITGASSGIGMALAKVFAKNNHNLILVARRKNRLEALKQEIQEKHTIDVHFFCMDLTEAKAPQKLYNEINNKQLSVEILINNAGFGDFALFEDTDISKLEKMIQLNINALTSITRLFIPTLIAQNKAYILNNASTAAFQALPYMAVYAATKAYVESFSEAIAEELADKNIHVMSLCPGPTKSEFGKVAGVQDNSAVFKNNKQPSSTDVAEYAYKMLFRKKRVAIHGFRNKLLVLLTRIIPRKSIVRMAKRIMQKIK